VDLYADAAAYAERIERALRKLNVWRAEPLPDTAYDSDQAFFLDTMTLYQWLQFVLVPRIQEIVAERGAFPAESYVGAHAVREFDGVDEAAGLVSLLIEFDEFIERLHRGSKSAPGKRAARTHRSKPVTSPVQLTETPPESPLTITERYWRTRDPGLLHSSPHRRPSLDVQLAGRVFEMATGFSEFVGEPREIAEGMVVASVIESERGLWVVLTVLRKDTNQWRVDIPLSLEHTALMFLRQHHIHPPYTEVDDARGRAMQFWQHVSNRNDRWAAEIALPEGFEIPHFGEGQIDEFFWYVNHTEGNGTATVRVLMNNHSECRMWLTRMVQRDGAWFVDLPGTLADNENADEEL
jgi:uncharacterized protein YqcC (DUF446 family)